MTSVAREAAAGHFGWIAKFFGAGLSASSARTQALLGWSPAGPDLLADLERGSYFAA